LLLKDNRASADVHIQPARHVLAMHPWIVGNQALWLDYVQALGRDSMASDIDSAERGDSDCESSLPAGSAVKAWHGRYSLWSAMECRWLAAYVVLSR
jgi:hypothetical protein